jgi:hypothetical protein
LTQMRQVHPWYLYWLYQERESPPPVLAG